MNTTLDKILNDPELDHHGIDDFNMRWRVFDARERLNENLFYILSGLRVMKLDKERYQEIRLWIERLHHAEMEFLLECPADYIDLYVDVPDTQKNGPSKNG